MTTSLTLLQQLSQFAAAVTYESLPAEVIASVKDRVLDTVGLCLAATPLETSAMAVKLAQGWGVNEEATTIGFPHKLPAVSAAFVNGVLAHSLDFDDTHLPSVLPRSICRFANSQRGGND